MANRSKAQVNTLVLHHSVTPLWSEKSKAELAQWFSDNGKARAYQNGAIATDLTNPYTGKPSYSQAHLAGQRVTAATPDATDAERAAGYRLVPLINDIWGMITWHAGNWATNEKSIGIENLGDYRNYTLRDGDCKVIADFWRPQDASLGGATTINGHKEVSDTATACPARIMEKRDYIVSLINAAAPAPVVTPPTPKLVITDITNKIVVTNKDANLWDLNFASWGAAKSLKVLPKGTELEVSAIAKHPLGSSYYLSEYSYGKGINNGVNVGDVADKPAVVVPPVVTPPPVVIPPTPVPVPTPTVDDEQNKRLNAIESSLAALKVVVDKIMAWIASWRNP